MSSMHGSGVEHEKYATLDDGRVLSADEMDAERRRKQAYEYLCHLQEAQEWMEENIGEKVGSGQGFEEVLRDGVALAKLVHSFSPETPHGIFEGAPLQYRHTDNINMFFRFSREIRLPEVFLFEVVDLYEKKNIPKVIYCIHALGHYLSRLKLTNKLKNLVGKATFTEEQIEQKQQEIKESGISMPSFSSISVAMDKDGRIGFGKDYPGDARPGDEEIDSDDLSFRTDDGQVDARNNRMGDDYLLDLEMSTAARVIQNKMRTFLAASALAQIYGDEELSVFSLRNYLPLFEGNEEEEEQRIESLNSRLAEMLRGNREQERQLDALENRIFLLIKNKIRVKGRIQDGLNTGITQFQYNSLQALFSAIHNDPSHLTGMLLDMRRGAAEDLISGPKLMRLFGNVTTQKEEYFFLKFVEFLLKKEAELSLKRGADFLAGRVIRKFLISQSHLDPIVFLSVSLKSSLKDVECDPSHIYASLHKCNPAPRDVALADEEVLNIYTSNLLKAGVAIEKLVLGIRARASTVHYSLRFFAKSLLSALNTRFPGKEVENMKGLVSYMWEVFFVPVFVAPDIFLGNKARVVDSERRAAIYACGIISSICSGEELSETAAPLSIAVGKIWGLLQEAFIEIIDTEGISDHYRPEFLDERVKSSNSLICIRGEDVNEFVRVLRGSASPSLSSLIEECGSLPSSEKILFVAHDNENHEEAPEKQRLTSKLRAAKWAVVRLLMHSPGKNLVDVLQRRATFEEDLVFDGDLNGHKEAVLSHLKALEKMGVVDKNTFYGEVLAFIAGDIVHRVTRSAQRAKEIGACERAIKTLEKAQRDIDDRREACGKYLSMVYEKMIGNKRPVRRSAKGLIREGILADIADIIPSQTRNIDFVFSGELTGLIHIEVYILGMKSGTSNSVKLDELLLKEVLGDMQILLPEIGCVFNIKETVNFINKRFLS